MRFAIFPLHLFKSIAPATKKWCQVIRSAAPVTQNHLSKPEDLMLQNATYLRKSAPWPPNISDEHVSCAAPAMRNASLQILCKCVFNMLTWTACTFRHLNFQKCFEAGVFCTFWLGNVLRATTACTFSTSQFPKVLRAWCVLCMLKRATFLPFRAPASSFFLLFRFFDLLSSSLLFSSLLWLLPPLLFHLSILSEIWLLHFLRFYLQ